MIYDIFDDDYLLEDNYLDESYGLVQKTILTQPQIIVQPQKEKKEKEYIWKSDLIVVKSLTILLPFKIVSLVKEIARKIDDEFSIFLKGYLDEDYLVVKEDFYIPQQEVSHASVDYKEPPPEGFNGVLHRHPTGLKSFSSTDEKYINQNFDFSILYIPPDDFPDAIINIKISENVKLQVGADVDILYPYYDFDIDELIEKIEKQVVTYSYNRHYIGNQVSTFFEKSQKKEEVIK